MTNFVGCDDSCFIGPVKVRIAKRDAALAAISTLLGMSISRQNEGDQFVAFCNAQTVNLARASSPFTQALSQALVLNDGVGVDIARKLLYGASFPANLQGTDLTTAVLGETSRHLRLFLLGSPPGIADIAAVKLKERFPQHDIVGTHHGFFEETDGHAVALLIAATKADLVLAGMGQPFQEIWAARHGKDSGALVMCIGAYLDFTAGVVRRAPLWLQRVRLEWAFRLLQEPRRLAPRYILGAGKFFADLRRDRLQKLSTSADTKLRKSLAEIQS